MNLNSKKLFGFSQHDCPHLPILGKAQDQDHQQGQWSIDQLYPIDNQVIRELVIMFRFHCRVL